MVQDDELQAVFARYQSLPLFEGCKVDSVNAIAVDDEPILHKAIMMKDVMSVIILLNNSADPNLIGNFGFTPLHQAAFNNNQEIAEILVRFGAKLDTKNENGDTAVDLAKAHRSPIMYEYFKEL